MRNGVCVECSNPFTYRKHGSRFCSKRCSGIATARARGQSPKQEVSCEACGKRWLDYASNDRRFCSKQCTDAAAVIAKPECVRCGKPCTLSRNRFCSKSCSSFSIVRPPGKSWSRFYRVAQLANPDPLPCAECGAPGKHRHHEDYAKPEVVVWLCESHHHSLHSSINRHGKHGAARVRPVQPIPV